MDTAKNDAEATSPIANQSSTGVAVGRTRRLSRPASSSGNDAKSSAPVVAVEEAIEESPEAESGDVSLLGTRSDSEAETVVPNGRSPSKTKREVRKIKLEDKSTDVGIPEDIGSDVEMENTRPDESRSSPTSEGATSSLGKRKRAKQNANSSGLSSVPTSPVAIAVEKPRRRFSEHAPVDFDSDASKALSAPENGSGKPVRGNRKLSDKAALKADHGDTERDKERKHFKRHENFASDQSRQHHKRGYSHLTREEEKLRKRSRSKSPQRNHRRSVSSSATNGNGTSHRKKRVPTPLRATRDSASQDSDSYSESNSPQRQPSHRRNLATPPTGDSLSKMPRGKNAHHRTPLMNACDKGNLESAKQLFKENPETLDEADLEGNTPLQCASLNGHADVVKWLLDVGCKIHTMNNEKDSPLLDAVENGHLEVVKLLLAAGVNPKQRNREGHEPIDKLREDADDYKEILRVLQKARSSWVGTTTYAKPSVPVQSPHPEKESVSARNRRTQSHGRSAKTGDNHLYTSYNIESLREAAGRGSLNTVVGILQVLPECTDVRSLIAAARGGHDEVLSMILGLTGMSADTEPLEDVDWNHATPMLAAIGGDNIKVIDLLLDQIDPTRVFNGMTYPEWARQGRGPLWQEEERKLQEAFDKYKATSAKKKSSASNSSPTRHRQRLSDHSVRSTGSRDHGTSDSPLDRKRAGSPTAGTPSKRGPGRPRKEGRESIDQQDVDVSNRQEEKVKSRRNEADNLLTSPEAETKPRRKKLVSGKELREDQESKHRRASVVSAESPSSVVSESESRKLHPSVSQKPETHLSPGRTETSAIKLSDRPREGSDSKQRLGTTRDDSPTKRTRSSLSPPSSPRSAGSGLHKRRRLEGVKREPRPSSSPDRKSLTNERRQLSQPSIDIDSPSERNIIPTKSQQSANAQAEKKMSDKMEIEKNQAEEVKRAEEAAARQRDTEVKRLAEVAAREEAERKKAEEIKLAAQKREEREKAERQAKEEAIRLQQQKEKEEEARRVEESRQRQIELERQRKEEREQRQRELERQREQQLKKREEEKRRREKEEEEARLSKLPYLLRWFDRHPKPASKEVAELFTTILGFRYDTIRPEYTGRPEGRDEWILNTHAALLLGEKDLRLSRYTAWEHIPVSRGSKIIAWRLENGQYSMKSPGLFQYNPERTVDPETGKSKAPDYKRLWAMSFENERLWLALDLTFVKLSDFMSVIHLHPHLKDVRMRIDYKEAPPPEWAPSKNELLPKQKWLSDPEALLNKHHAGPFPPDSKIYVNGILVDSTNNQVPVFMSSRPLHQRSEDRGPMRGPERVLPNHPDYRALCIEQGLQHLLPDGGILVNNGVTPPASNGSEEPRRASESSPITQQVSNADTPAANGFHDSS